MPQHLAGAFRISEPSDYSEVKPRAKLELARRVERFADRAEWLAARGCHVLEIWIPKLRRVEQIVRGDVKSQRLVLRNFECLVNRDVQVVRALCTDVV